VSSVSLPVQAVIAPRQTTRASTMAKMLVNFFMVCFLQGDRFLAAISVDI
jgi:hypothetical protein